MKFPEYAKLVRIAVAKFGTQAKLGAAVGRKEGAVGLWFNGHTRPNEQILRKLAELVPEQAELAIKLADEYSHHASRHKSAAAGSVAPARQERPREISAEQWEELLQLSAGSGQEVSILLERVIKLGIRHFDPHGTVRRAGRDKDRKKSHVA